MVIHSAYLLPWILLAGLLAAVASVAYFVWAGLRSDHETGDYAFTWGVGIVVLFLLGFAPGLVGVGLYLTIERDYPVGVLLGAAVLALLVIGVLGLGVSSQTTGAVIGTVGSVR